MPLPDGVRPESSADLQLAGLLAGVGGHSLGRCFNLWIPPPLVKGAKSTVRNGAKAADKMNALQFGQGKRNSALRFPNSGQGKPKRKAGIEMNLAVGDMQTQVLRRLFSPTFTDQIAVAPCVVVVRQTAR